MKRLLTQASVTLLLSIALIVPATRPGFVIVSEAKQVPPEASWLVHWKRPPGDDFYRKSVVIRSEPDQHMMVAQPRPGTNPAAWAEHWRASADILNIEPNQTVHIAKLPNDPLQANEHYLSMIHAEQAWDHVTANTNITIAIVDTGVDLTHPDLADNLVPGYNLLDPSKPPQDDNGHGTNVAGVIAGRANNDKGVAGLLWQARIMPIKALGADGNGDEDKLGEGIRYAVDHGAKIIVLSLGLNKYSAYMQGVVDYAEQHGVLLVAASGNEGKAVKYPAAYPTVLAVGGAATDGKPEDLSNYGPELDVIAPWDVFTTDPGGKYDYRDGTSLAAPQVAAVCAMIWAQHPDWAPYQVRDQIRQTADNTVSTDWTPHAGYGLLRADRAVTESHLADRFEPNDRQADARILPLLKTSDATFASGADADWYVLQSPYAGNVQLNITPEGGPLAVRMTVADANGRSDDYSFTAGKDDAPTFSVSKGQTWIKLAPADPGLRGPVVYHATPAFTIYRDPFEDNDASYKSYVLPLRSQALTGTFDHRNDADWYELPVQSNGMLRVKVYVDSSRMDPVLTVQRQGEKELVFDNNGDGQGEETYTLDVSPGNYYIKVANQPDYQYPVLGEYTLQIDYRPNASDPYEPNDKSYEATEMKPGESYNGILDGKNDVDWYRLRLDQSGWLKAGLGAFSENASLHLSLLDNALAVLQETDTSIGDGVIQSQLPAGTYYFKVTGTADVSLPYQLEASLEALTSGYRDIDGHWASRAIQDLTAKGILSGYEDRMFYPDRAMTRAEAATAILRAYPMSKPAGPSTSPFSDLSPDQWYYDAILRASDGGIIDGYPDGTFRPNQMMTRMEMTAMIARAIGLNGADGRDNPFADTPASYWGAPLLRQMKALGWVDGYPDGSFYPGRAATRAEFAALLDNVIEKSNN